MTKNFKGTAAIAGAIGSAAIAAALLYANRRKDKGEPPRTSKAPHTPTGEPPETD
ncbi:MAG: isopropylmalate isomerase [Alteripontixanthobacter sp.]|mgnify:CR=1 FL=1